MASWFPRPPRSTCGSRPAVPGPMVTLANGARRLSLSWPTALPEPVLQGDTATYSEVMPGVDLRLGADTDSFAHILVVKNAKAARNPALRELRFGLETTGISVQQGADGVIRAVDSTGEPIFLSDGARMWDSASAIETAGSRGGAAAAVAAEGGATESAWTEDVPVRLSSDALTVVPSAHMLTSPAARFPLYIDPGFNGGREIWTHVSRKNPNTSYWTDDNRDDMRVGQLWNGADDDDWRTLVQFNVSPLRDTKIVGAHVLTTVGHTGDCGPSPLQLWQTNRISSSSTVTWNNTKNKWWKRIAEVKATANKHVCPKGDDEVRFDQTAVRTMFQRVADEKGTMITLAFRAKSESDKYQWKKLTPGSTYLEITYNRKPVKPTGLKISPCNTNNCTSPVLTYLTKPTLEMAVSDPDGGTLTYRYEVWDGAKKVKQAESKDVVTGAKSGTTRRWTPPRALAEGLHYWRGVGCD